MVDVHKYLRDEFRRYFPNATRIDVNVTNEGEAYDVGIVLPDVPKPLHYHMDVGSDDGCFAFTNEYSGATITVPFPREMRS